MSDSLQARTGFNAFRARRNIAAGMLGVLVLAGCGSETQSPPTPNTTASTASETPTQSQTPEAQKTGMVTDVPMLNEDDIRFTANLLNGTNLDDIAYYLDGRFGSYYYKVAQGACIPKFLAEANEQVRQRYLEIDAEWKTVDPENYTELSLNGSIARKFELPTLALLQTAQSNETCPNGSNNAVIAFKHDGASLETNAKALLIFTQGGVQDILKQHKTKANLKQKIKFYKELASKSDSTNDGQINEQDIRDRYGVVLPNLATLEAQLKILTYYGK